MNKKVIILVSVLAVVSLSLSGCKKVVAVDGNAVTLKGIKIKSNDYYSKIKESNISKLIDEIDHKLFDKKYSPTEEENKEIDDQIDQLKQSIEQYYGSSDKKTFNKIVKQYYGVKNEKELRKQLSINYVRKQAVNDYIKENLTDQEIKDYYNDNIFGDMTASHILISVDVADDATDEEKQEAEEKAKKKAEKVISELNDGKKFKDLAKKYSDDEGTKNKGGSLGTFKYSDMVSEFSEACKNLKEKEYSKEPVKTQYGYHIIYKEKEEDKPKLKKVKDEIKDTLTQKKLDEDSTLYEKTLIEIRDKKKIKWKDTELEQAYNDYNDELIEQAEKQTTNE